MILKKQPKWFTKNSFRAHNINSDHSAESEFDDDDADILIYVVVL